MEAMACGLPAVLSDVKGHEDLVRSGENGLLFPYDDQNAFIRAVKQAAEPVLQAQMSAAAVQTAVPYGIECGIPHAHRDLFSSNSLINLRRFQND